MTTSTTPPATPTATFPAALPAMASSGPSTRPGGPSRSRRGLALALLVSAQFVVMLDTSIVNVALPSIQSSLSLGASSLSWVVNAYVLTFGGLLLLCGRVADHVGRRRMFTVGSALFTVGTLVAAAATSEWMLLTGRVVQGAGAACLSPAAMALLLVNFPGERRARAMSLWGAASTLGGATGVAAGGLLAGTFGWSSVFMVTVPVSLLAVVMAGRVLNDIPQRANHHFDLSGAVTITGAVVALVHGALSLASGSWEQSAIVGVAVPVALTALFIRAERRAPEPLVPLDLFRSRMLATGVALAVLGGAARASTFVLVALYLQQALAMSPAAGGLAMVPTSLTGFVVSLVLLPRVLRRFGPLVSLIAGLVVLAGGHLWLACAPDQAGYLLGVLPGLFLVAAGVALSFTPTTMVIASAVPDAHAGLASGLASSATQVGAALGTAAFTTLALRESGSGFPAAFLAAATVALTTAVLGCIGARR
ncbi:MFS transporter [Nocardioides sp. STR2]|uniref:MFS transporter n=1 Tax=Nocardioides pini TaxID=2975053 RepID=A0ABT4CCH3_9ACTN|nr:MFS transporter [Nocardioides pini]MCY4726668.1 MFS transporter [Nocardioides pini]